MARRAKSAHAARVAAVATAVVMVVYAAAVLGLNSLVVNRLTREVDARLASVLAAAQQSVLPQATTGTVPPSTQGSDIDDAPSFVWRVEPTGAITPLTTGAPVLERRTWDTGPTTLQLGGTQFRFDAIRDAPGWLVVGQSIAEVQRVRDALWVPVLVFGLGLLVAVFVGSLVVGLRASAPLEEIRRRQAEFTADASHELRTPLSVIEAEVELALSEPQQPEEYVGVLRRVAGEGRRLRRIVDDLLWLARVDREKATSSTGAPTELAPVVAACARRFEGVAETREVTLTFHPSPRPLAVHVAPDLLDRLTGVLVDNACKFAGVGGTVDVWVCGSGNRAGLMVDDSGPGIAPEDRPLIFDRFHRSADASEGAGLGLAIADSVVRATQGSWVVGDAPTGGARMGVWWPKAAGRDEEPPSGGEGGTPRRPHRLAGELGAGTAPAGAGAAFDVTPAG
jgi:signal transduction histidine kinase